MATFPATEIAIGIYLGLLAGLFPHRILDRLRIQVFHKRH